MLQEEPQIDLVQQAIDDVIPTESEPCEMPSGAMCSEYTPLRPIVQTIAHLQQHADGTLADILATLRRMAEETVQSLEDEKAQWKRWLEYAEKALHRIQPQRDALVHEVVKLRESDHKDDYEGAWESDDYEGAWESDDYEGAWESDDYEGAWESDHKDDYEGACFTIARMHEAATGVTGAAPKRGVVEDVQDLRNEWARLQNERTAITSRLGVEGTEHSFVLDHIDYLKREAKGYAHLQDIADGYRATLLKIADAAKHDNWPEGLDWYGRMTWMQEIIGAATDPLREVQK